MNYYGDSKSLRRSIFSMAGSFGVFSPSRSPTIAPTKSPTKASTEVRTKVSRRVVEVHLFCFHLFCCDHTCPIQNTKPLGTPKYTPKYTPNPPPKPKYRKNTKNIRKSPYFIYFSYFFCIWVLEGDLGCISGCISGFRGVLYFVWGTYMIATVLFVGH